LPQPIRKTALAAANYHVVLAGLALGNAGIPKDAPELLQLKEVIRLLRVRGAERDKATG
jgi:hypothetical protein